MDISKYNQGPNGTPGTREMDLYKVSEDSYPIIISIETIYPEGYRGKGRKNIQYTYGTFQKDDNSTELKYKFLKQKLLYNN